MRNPLGHSGRMGGAGGIRTGGGWAPRIGPSVADGITGSSPPDAAGGGGTGATCGAGIGIGSGAGGDDGGVTAIGGGGGGIGAATDPGGSDSRIGVDNITGLIGAADS